VGCCCWRYDRGIYSWIKEVLGGADSWGSLEEAYGFEEWGSAVEAVKLWRYVYKNRQGRAQTRSRFRQTTAWDAVSS